MRTKIKLLRILMLSIISIIIFVAISYIAAFSFNLKIIFGSIIYFLGTYFIVRSAIFGNKLLPFFLIATPPILIFIFFNLLQFKATASSFPSSLFLIISTIFGYLFYKSRYLFIPLILGTLIIVWIGFLQKFYNNIRVYKTYNQEALLKYPAVSLYDTTGSMVALDDNNKYYFIDFWTSHCAPCFRLFPKIDSINKLADTSRLEFIAINIPMEKEVKEDNYRILNDFDYTFKKLYAGATSVADSFQVSYFPTTVVVKNSQVIFRGDFETAVKRFKAIR